LVRITAASGRLRLLANNGQAEEIEADMRKTQSRWIAATVAAVMITPVAVAADDPTVNRLLASQCAQCHGTNGYAVGDIDCLAGKSVKDIYNEMLDMKDSHDNEIMKIQAKGYTDDQLLRIATYFASLPDCED